ncbi:yellow cameleon 2.60 [Tribonema minus]|uniref:Calmodulin n=1 Tax=Tribonema minus TaxID=303371 RepID=A0A835YVZ2_9STRA|nr:yellow cameleon 2.60 [Tribonema minus]
MSKEMKALSTEEVEDYEEAFKNFDKGGNGEIDLKELGIVMRSLGYSPTDKQLRDMLQQVDEDGNGVITFNEFVEMMRRCELSTDFELEIKGAFEYDMSTDFELEIKGAFEMMLRCELSTDFELEIKGAFEFFDKDGSGDIIPEELASIMRGLGANLRAIDLHEFTAFLYS